MTADFTPAGYRTMLESFLERGYRVCGFAGADPNRKHLILRHDLDMSIQAALPIAEIERDLGLGATYFVMVRSEMYNPFSHRALTALEQLVNLGHEIGLHFDAALYPEGVDSLDEAAELECIALETFTGHKVQILSFHRLGVHLQSLDRLVAGRRHAYEPRFFASMGYCSDSQGSWRHGNPVDHPVVVEGRGLQLLTHPIWWHATPDESVREKLDRFSLTRFDLLRAELARNCKSYPQEFQVLDSESEKIRESPNH